MLVDDSDTEDDVVERAVRDGDGNALLLTEVG